MNVYFVGAKSPEVRRQIAAQQRAHHEFRPVGFVDNDPEKWGQTFVDLPVLGGFAIVPRVLEDDPAAYFVNLITGSTRARFETSAELAKLGCRFTNLIHPSVDLTDVEVGVGNYIQEDVKLQGGVTVGNNSSIHVGAVVSHESVVGHSVFISHALIGGEVTLEDGSFVGLNGTITPRRTVGRWATVGAGAIVIADVAAGSTVVGNPARVVREADEPLPSSGDLGPGPKP